MDKVLARKEKKGLTHGFHWIKDAMFLRQWEKV